MLDDGKAKLMEFPYKQKKKVFLKNKVEELNLFPIRKVAMTQ